MGVRTSRRRTLSAFLVAGAAAALVAVGSPAMADPVLWNGFGRGMTPERAIENAIDDVEIMASGEGLFHCELYEEPLVWQAPNETSYQASVNMTCE